MIKIILPITDLNEAIDVRDRVKKSLLVEGETARIGDGGVVISTNDPVRVCMELEATGLILGNG
jgi:hypothetical protein